MGTRASQNLKVRKSLFLLLLVVVAGAIVYAIVQNLPWTVPAEARQIKNPLQASVAALQSIRPIYLDKCATCHGDTGKADGHDSSRYSPSPTNFTDAKQMNSVTDGELFYKLSEGHRPMPAFKKRLSEDQRWRLVLLLRSFAEPPAPEPAGSS